MNPLVLRVSLDRFAEEVRRRLEVDNVYLCSLGSGSLATAAEPEMLLTVAAVSSEPVGLVRTKLEATGLKVREGCWGDPSSFQIEEPHSEAWVAAVAYKTGREKPGLWVDAYPSEPTRAQVMRAMYDEFIEQGEVPEMTFEAFMASAMPSVVLIGPEEIRRYAEAHEADEE